MIFFYTFVSRNLNLLIGAALTSSGWKGKKLSTF